METMQHQSAADDTRDRRRTTSSDADVYHAAQPVVLSVRRTSSSTSNGREDDVVAHHGPGTVVDADADLRVRAGDDPVRLDERVRRPEDDDRPLAIRDQDVRSEERRVGKECRAGWAR